MKYYLARHIPLLLALSLSAPFVSAQEEQIYGQQLMTEQERAEHREQMRNMDSEEERKAFRQEHHERMQQRAEERGVTLPDEPGQRGKGMNQSQQKKGMGHEKGRGMDQGRGQGMGGGKGSGQGKNRGY
ncbi:MAG: hypothetical protein RI563_04440 [Thiohalophilus sp.]|uniref:hypothetical protein n=1 Tax=Thiohalophilus sp. TaxID=3028392 RepID=UPI002870482C|nr:hypothetical protein [Thiohalophilus sp.]MDR9436099.1 hypothetical protein [Thiohalophilus sp.]